MKTISFTLVSSQLLAFDILGTTLSEDSKFNNNVTFGMNSRPGQKKHISESQLG